MVYSKDSRIGVLEYQRSNLELELSFIADNLSYFESVQSKYDLQIGDLEQKFVKDDADLKEKLFLEKLRNDLVDRITNLSVLRLKKISRVDIINDELKKLY